MPDTLSYFPSDTTHSPHWSKIVDVLGLYNGQFETLYLFMPLVAFGGGIQNTSIASIMEWDMYYVPFLSILAVNARHSSSSGGQTGRSDTSLLWVAIPDPDPNGSRDIIGFLLVYLCRRNGKTRVKVSPPGGRRAGGAGGRARVPVARHSIAMAFRSVELYPESSNQQGAMDAGSAEATAADEWKECTNATVDTTFRKFLTSGSGEHDSLNFCRVVLGCVFVCVCVDDRWLGNFPSLRGRL